jgi:hypothetical protein
MVVFPSGGRGTLVMPALVVLLSDKDVLSVCILPASALIFLGSWSGNSGRHSGE